jgi:sec-independent protein translocase protein TatB
MNLTPQIGFFEIVVIAVIALVVVGPKELPRLMRMAGKFASQARRMAGEFQAAFNQMARDTELDDMRREIEALKRINPIAEVRRDVEAALRPIETSLNEVAQEAARDAGKPAP